MAGPLKSATQKGTPPVFVEVITISTTEGVVLIASGLSLSNHYLQVRKVMSSIDVFVLAQVVHVRFSKWHLIVGVLNSQRAIDAFGHHVWISFIFF